MGEWPDCKHCGHEIRYDKREDAEPPTICGTPYCRALENWGPAEWEGRARMAEAHLAAGLELNVWDETALVRVGRFMQEQHR